MDLNRQELLSQLRQMDEYEFEKLVADVWEQRGWTTTVTSSSSDRGIDVVAEKSSPFSQKQLIQAKRYSAGNKIGGPDIQQYSSLRHQENDVDAVVVVTSSSFSSQARQRAEELNVKLVDGEGIYDMISDLDSQDLLSGYLNTDMSKRGQRNSSAREYVTLPNDFNKQRNTTIFGQFCPICSEKRSVWQGKTDDTDPLLICEKCGTEWVEVEEEERTGILSYSTWTEWKAIGKDMQKEAAEWEKMNPNKR